MIHAREGERIGPQGLLELGKTQRMYVVAEVYETDIGLVEVGQRAVARSPALGADPVTGSVERIVEVFILLDDPARVAVLTNLQVDVEIGD